MRSMKRWSPSESRCRCGACSSWNAGQYHAPYLDPVALHESAIELTSRTPTTGCRSLDILHIAAARLLEAELFVTGDRRQGALGKSEGLSVKLV